MRRFLTFLRLLFLVIAVVAMGGCGKTNTTNTVSTSTPHMSLPDSATMARWCEQPNAHVPPDAWKSFDKDFFAIMYPPKFTRGYSFNEVEKITDDVTLDQPDTAYFISPDKTVGFYVYSPQWNGEPFETGVRTGEKIISEIEMSAACPQDKNDLYTFDENASSTLSVFAGQGYTREVLDIEHQNLNTRRTFAIEYRTEADRARYWKQFLQFTNGLTQYAD